MRRKKIFDKMIEYIVLRLKAKYMHAKRFRFEIFLQEREKFLILIEPKFGQNLRNEHLTETCRTDSISSDFFSPLSLPKFR